MSKQSKKLNSGWKIPSPFEFAILLTVLVILIASFFTESNLSQNILYWGDGLWTLLSFMTQMCLILLGGYVVAIARPVRSLLKNVVQIPRSSFQVYLLTFIVSVFACWLNWGLGLVVSAFFALEMARFHKNIHFPLLVSISYMGFIFWHGGMSGSIPLVISTPGNFTEVWMGEIIGLERTIFSNFNMLLILSLLISFIVFIFILNKRVRSVSGYQLPDEPVMMVEQRENKSFLSPYFYWTLIGIIAFYLGSLIFSGDFKFSLNQVNLILILIGLTLHQNSEQYLFAVREACSSLAPILIQYPLYAGIMGVIIKSGLAVSISNTFVSMSSPQTYSLYMFLSAGIVNFFVPSGGGQWAVQAPVVIEGAKELGVPLWKASLAVAWGDAWTNLAQPFWALPLLSIVGLGIKDIMEYCLMALLLSGFVIGGFFLIF